MNVNFECVYQLTPILLIFLYVTNRGHFTSISNSVLGKVIAILIIALYTTLDKYLGLLICALIILYYHNIHMEQSLSTKLQEGTEENMSNDTESVPVDGWYFPKLPVFLPGTLNQTLNDVDREGMANRKINEDTKQPYDNSSKITMSVSENKFEAEEMVNKKCNECIYTD